jgi:hypothetical protein
MQIHCRISLVGQMEISICYLQHEQYFKSGKKKGNTSLALSENGIRLAHEGQATKDI